MQRKGSCKLSRKLEAKPQSFAATLLHARWAEVHLPSLCEYRPLPVYRGTYSKHPAQPCRKQVHPALLSESLLAEDTINTSASHTVIHNNATRGHTRRTAKLSQAPHCTPQHGVHYTPHMCRSSYRLTLNTAAPLHRYTATPHLPK